LRILLMIAKMLVAVGLKVVVVTILLGQVGVAQSGAGAETVAGAAKLPGWDVVSVKPVEAQTCGQGSRMRMTADAVNILCVPLEYVIQQAYDILGPGRIVGMPEWANITNSGGYEINAKVAAQDVARYGKLSREEKLQMLQPLLEDRFRLKAHLETRVMPVYELVVAKGGPKLKEATADESVKAPRLGGVAIGKIVSVASPLKDLALFLTSEVDRPVVDRTGLTGKYDFTFEYMPAASALAESEGPSIFTVVQEQLGLKLEPVKAPMDVMVIDHIERPSAN
jgi:uncharacterized protein (TIGR03435 family)